MAYDRPEPYERLETALAAWSGVPHAVCCASGTSALHLALESLLLPLGAEIITCDFNMVAVARAVTLAGMVPVFVDCTDDLLLDPDRLDEAASTCDRARVVMPVHIYGRRVDMDAVALLARKHNLIVVEDLAEAHGVPVHPDSAAGCLSFYANKIVTGGAEGGAVLYPDHGEAGASRAMLARQLRCLGFGPEHDFNHRPRGMNYRLANLLATPILASLAAFDANVRARRQIETWYDAHCPDEWRMPPRSVPWVFDVRLPGLTPELQTRIVKALQTAGIQARHAFRPMSSQEEYRHCRTFGTERTAKASRTVFYLPVQPGITTEATAARAFEVIRREV